MGASWSSAGRDPERRSGTWLPAQASIGQPIPQLRRLTMHHETPQMSGPRRRPSAAERLYRGLLRLLPQEFRGDFGDSMARDFAERDRELIGARRRGFQARELPALAWTIVRQRIEDAWRDVRFGLPRSAAGQSSTR